MYIYNKIGEEYKFAQKIVKKIVRTKYVKIYIFNDRVKISTR